MRNLAALHWFGLPRLVFHRTLPLNLSLASGDINHPRRLAQLAIRVFAAARVLDPWGYNHSREHGAFGQVPGTSGSVWLALRSRSGAVRRGWRLLCLENTEIVTPTVFAWRSGCDQCLRMRHLFKRTIRCPTRTSVSAGSCRALHGGTEKRPSFVDVLADREFDARRRVALPFRLRGVVT